MSHINDDSNNFLLVFGGENKNGLLNNELWMFNISSLSWILEKNSNLNPIVISQHAASVVTEGNEKFLYVYGGKTTKNSEILFSSTIYRFRWSTKSWEKVYVNNGDTSQTLLQRAGHSMVYDNFSNTLLVFGGYELPEDNGRIQRSQTLLTFDLNRFLWTEIASTKSDFNMPKPLAFHTANVIGDYMIIQGGSTHVHTDDETCHDNVLYFYNLRCNLWSQRPHSGSSLKPSGRFAHVATVAQNVLLVHGGYSGLVLNDVWAFKVPFFVDKMIPFVCSLYRNADSCIQDQRCGWTGGSNRFGCFPANYSFVDEMPKCPGICRDVRSCSACSSANR